MVAEKTTHDGTAGDVYKRVKNGGCQQQQGSSSRDSSRAGAAGQQQGQQEGQQGAAAAGAARGSSRGQQQEQQQQARSCRFHEAWPGLSTGAGSATETTLWPRKPPSNNNDNNYYSNNSNDVSIITTSSSSSLTTATSVTPASSSTTASLVKPASSLLTASAAFIHQREDEPHLSYRQRLTSYIARQLPYNASSAERPTRELVKKFTRATRLSVGWCMVFNPITSRTRAAAASASAACSGRIIHLYLRRRRRCRIIKCLDPDSRAANQPHRERPSRAAISCQHFSPDRRY